MIKLHGFGGPSQFWDYNLESFTLMAGLAAVTTRIQLFATCAVLTMPPPIAARMAMTIDSIAPGRFGVNLFVPGLPSAEAESIAGYVSSLAPHAEAVGASLGEPAWDDDHLDEKLAILLADPPALVSFTFGCSW